MPVYFKSIVMSSYILPIYTHTKLQKDPTTPPSPCRRSGLVSQNITQHPAFVPSGVLSHYVTRNDSCQRFPSGSAPNLSLSCPRFVTSYHHQLHNCHYHIGSQLVVDIGIRLFLMFQVKFDREVRGSSYPHA